MYIHKHFLRELSKFASGLIAADLIMGLWLLYAVPLPITLFNIPWTASNIMAWTVFDVLLLLVLIHYSWHADIHTPSLKQKKLFLIIGIIMGLVALMHLLRLIFGVSLDIGGWQAPYWMSWVATIVAACISYISFTFSSK